MFFGTHSHIAHIALIISALCAIWLFLLGVIAQKFGLKIRLPYIVFDFNHIEFDGIKMGNTIILSPKSNHYG
jgi:hypothetical protein